MSKCEVGKDYSITTNDLTDPKVCHKEFSVSQNYFLSGNPQYLNSISDYFVKHAKYNRLTKAHKQHKHNQGSAALKLGHSDP